MGWTPRGRRFAIALSLLAGLCVSGGAARAEESFGSSPMSQAQWVSYSWIDATGKVAHLPWSVQSSWMWAPVPLPPREAELPGAPRERPVLRTWVEVRAPAQLLEARPKSGRLALSASDSPFRFKRGKTLSIDSETALNEVYVRYKDEGGAEREYTLLIKTSIKRPLFWVHESCNELGLWLTKKNDEDGRFLYAGIRCEERGDSINLYVFNSPDSVMAEEKLPGKLVEEGTGWRVFHFQTPAAARTIGLFTVGSPASREVSSNYVVYTPNETKGRYSFNGSLGMTGISYTETPNSIRLSELGLTGKVGGAYKLVPDLFDLSGNAFMTLIPMTWQNTSLPLARFYGINGRVGWQLPITPFNRLYTLSGGWYFWGMMVQNQLYGVQALAGPQLLLSMRTPWNGPRSYYAYAKLALIADQPAIPQFSNHELAAGGGYMLDVRVGSRPITLTLDVANVNFASSSQGNSLGLLTVTTGVAFAL